jgi:hypothetical protein
MHFGEGLKRGRPHGGNMRRREPMDIDRTLQHSVPVPMPNRPVCVTEQEALDQLARLPRPPRMFLWTDSERRCLPDWGFIASVRQGVPPEGIEAELEAWKGQYPGAWLAVDLRDGVIPPSTASSLNAVLARVGRPVLILVSSSSEHEDWPQWVLPE